MKHELPITEYQLARRVNTGIEIKSPSGVVPEYEEREAAIFAHYNWTQWVELTWQERAQIVAHYRLHLLIQGHVDEAVGKAQERLMKR